jgi:hypothetical protein
MHNPKYIIFADNSLKEKRKTKYERRLQHTRQEQRQGVRKCLAPLSFPDFNGQEKIVSKQIP